MFEETLVEIYFSGNLHFRIEFWPKLNIKFSIEN